jgi:hypothetical protein
MISDPICMLLDSQSSKLMGGAWWQTNALAHMAAINEKFESSSRNGIQDTCTLKFYTVEAMHFSRAYMKKLDL